MIFFIGLCESHDGIKLLVEFGVGRRLVAWAIKLYLSIVLECTCGRSERIRSLIGDISPREWAIILDPMQRRGRHASMGICLVSSCTLDSDDLEVDNQKEPPCRT